MTRATLLPPISLRHSPGAEPRRTNQALRHVARPSSTSALLLTCLVLAAPVGATPRLATASHDYLLGRFAAADNRPGDAARYFGAALKADPNDPVLERRAFDAALTAGDERLATSLARDLDVAGQGDAATALVRLADALRRKDYKGADAVRGLPDTGYAAVVAPVVGAWAAFGRGDVDAALALVDPAKATGIARSYLTEHRAMILAAAHRPAEAAPLFVAMVGDEARNVDRLRIAGAAALAAAGQRDAAAGLLAVGDADPVLAAAAKRLAGGQRLDSVTEPRVGIAYLATRLAGDLARERPVPLATAFARVATFLAPEVGETWLVAGDVLARSGNGDAALAAYARVPADDALAGAATRHRGAALADLGRSDEARRVLAAAAAEPGATADDWRQLGDLERRLGRHAAAATDYDRAVRLAGDRPPWPLLFYRGTAYEQAGDWTRGEADLRAALALAPDEPTVLNYLGYALLDRNQQLPEATDLIARAAKLRPDDGAIANSFGWALYRAGDFARAVTVLEGAARLEPGDATINDHLGDAYWRAGRRLEARFRWRAAADLAPEPAEAALLAKKLDYGLDVAVAQAVK